MQSPIIFFGNERLATGLQDTEPLVLEALLQHGYKVGAVVSPYTPGRSRTNRPLEIEALATSRGIPVLKPTTGPELVKLVQAQPAAVGVLAAFGMIIPPELIAAFEYGIINLHPSLLPRYRGPTPIEQAMLDGAAETGVSVMQLDQGMDTGPVLAQQAIGLAGDESKAELARRLQQLGAKLVVEQLGRVLERTARLVPQDDHAATYSPPLSKNDGSINWQKPAVRLEREVRAYLGWPGSRTTLLNREVTITQARVANEAPQAAGQPGDHTLVGGELWAQTGEGTLAVQRLKPAGKREMEPSAFARGQRPPL